MADNDSSTEYSIDNSVFEKAVKEIFSLKRFTLDMLSSGACNSLLNSIYSVFKQALNTSLTQNVPLELSSALEQNVFFFSGFKTYRELSEVSALLKDESGTFKSFEKFKLDTSKVGKIYNENYMRAEYNFAVQSCQMAVKWHEYSKDADTYNLQYRTANDGKVRPAHQALNGTTLPLSDKFWNDYYPPLDWNCRCTVVQVRKNKYPLSDSNKAIKQGELATDTPKKKMFRFNAGKELKIFPSKHPYLPKDCGDCDVRKRINLYTKRDKGLPQCQSCQLFQKICLDQSEKKVKAWSKNNIDEQNGNIIKSNNLKSGSINIRRGSINDTLSHTANLDIHNALFDIENKVTQFKWHGWAPTKPNKHKDTAYFNYYEIVINGRTYYANVKVLKKDGKEVLYCIRDNIGIVNTGQTPI